MFGVGEESFRQLGRYQKNVIAIAAVDGAGKKIEELLFRLGGGNQLLHERAGPGEMRRGGGVSGRFCYIKIRCRHEEP